MQINSFPHLTVPASSAVLLLCLAFVFASLLFIFLSLEPVLCIAFLKPHRGFEWAHQASTIIQKLASTDKWLYFFLHNTYIYTFPLTNLSGLLLLYFPFQICLFNSVNVFFSSSHIPPSLFRLSWTTFTSFCVCSRAHQSAIPSVSPLTMHSITVQPPLICSLAEVLLITIHAPLLLSSGSAAVQKSYVYTHMSTHRPRQHTILLSSAFRLNLISTSEHFALHQIHPFLLFSYFRQHCI